MGPKRIRPDHGMPGAATTLGRRSPLSALWVRLGIRPACIAPGKPPQHGRQERRQRPLKAETIRPPARTRRAQPRPFDRFREACNFPRSHEALDMRTPATCAAPSPGRCRIKLPPLEYPDRFEVRDCQRQRWPPVAPSLGQRLHHVCVGASVGLEDIDEGVWNVDVGPLTLGRLLERI